LSSRVADVTSASARRGLSTAATFAQQAFATAAVCFGLVASLRKRGTRARQSRIVLGPTGMSSQQYKWRAKAGSKYRYRVATDMTPEWGQFPPESPDRIVYMGELIYKGTPQGPMRYKREQDAINSSVSSSGMGGALLLDCDGTLVETERDGHRVAFNEAFEEKGFDCKWSVELYGELLTTGGGKERMTRYFTDYNPEAWTAEDPPSPDHPTIKELHELKTEIFMDIVRSAKLPLREGIKELMTAAKEAGWKLAVCSTSNEASVTAVVQTMLPEFRDVKIFAGDIVTAKKPSPDVYELAAKELGVSPMRCVVVEDTNIGLQAGKAAGMQVIVTKSIYSQDEDFSDADVVVDSAEDISFEEDVAVMIPEMVEAEA